MPRPTVVLLFREECLFLEVPLNIKFQRAVDRLAGVPICALLSLVDRLRSAMGAAAPFLRRAGFWLCCFLKWAAWFSPIRCLRG